MLFFWFSNWRTLKVRANPERKKNNNNHSRTPLWNFHRVPSIVFTCCLNNAMISRQLVQVLHSAQSITINKCQISFPWHIKWSMYVRCMPGGMFISVDIFSWSIHKYRNATQINNYWTKKSTTPIFHIFFVCYNQVITYFYPYDVQNIPPSLLAIPT